MPAIAGGFFCLKRTCGNLGYFGHVPLIRYWEYWGKGYFNAKGVSIPVAVSVFPDELYPAPRSWTEKAYPKLIHYNRLPKGGHFAAWEQPQLFSEDIRAGFRSLR